MKNIETLRQYLNHQLNFCDVNPTASDLFHHNAFGAVEYALFLTNSMDEVDAINKLWEEEFQPQFVKKMMGE